jgi:hypothetical protein
MEMLKIPTLIKPKAAVADSTGAINSIDELIYTRKWSMIMLNS